MSSINLSTTYDYKPFKFSETRAKYDILKLAAGTTDKVKATAKLVCTAVFEAFQNLAFAIANAGIYLANKAINHYPRFEGALKKGSEQTRETVSAVLNSAIVVKTVATVKSKYNDVKEAGKAALNSKFVTQATDLTKKGLEQVRLAGKTYVVDPTKRAVTAIQDRFSQATQSLENEPGAGLP
jgi:hypothetical protein